MRSCNGPSIDELERQTLKKKVCSTQDTDEIRMHAWVCGLGWGGEDNAREAIRALLGELR